MKKQTKGLLKEIAIMITLTVVIATMFISIDLFFGISKRISNNGVAMILNCFYGVLSLMIGVIAYFRIWDDK